MARANSADVERMRGNLFIGPATPASASRFWALLVLAGIIAAAGVVADSTATVIGAMIVAPLMTPILGIALGVVLSDRASLLRSIGYVLGGALVVVAIGIALGWIVGDPTGFAENSQVNSRISPHLIDLLAALATGVVGAFALVRSDISDTLPGVAIAISLVPPLAVVGLLVSVSRYDAATHALLLFATNVAAIVATGIIVLLVYRVRAAALGTVAPLRGLTLLTVMIFVVVVAVPLAYSSEQIAGDKSAEVKAQPVVTSWARAAGWTAQAVNVVDGRLKVTVIGIPPVASSAELRSELDAHGLTKLPVDVRYVYGTTATIPASG